MISSYLTLFIAIITFILISVQMASMQFSPRILRMFFPRNSLIFFISFYFLLCMINLVTIKIYYVIYPYKQLNQTIFMIASVSSGICVPLFFIFTSYIVQNLNVTKIAYNIKIRTIHEINTIFKKKSSNESENNLYHKSSNKVNNSTEENKINNKSCHVIYAPSNDKRIPGFVESYNWNKIKKLVQNYKNYKFYFNITIGQYVHTNDIIARYEIKENFPLDNQSCSRNSVGSQNNDNSKVKDVPDMIKKSVIDCFNFDVFRSFDEDIQFGIRQLVDIGVKSLSTAINDPTTAITCIYNIVDILLVYMQYDEKLKESESFEGNIYFKSSNFESIIDQCFDQFYHYGQRDVDVTKNIIRALTTLAKNCKDNRQLKVICDEFIDLNIYDGYLKYLLPLVGFRDEFRKKCTELQTTNLTEESVIVLLTEMILFCCAVYEIPVEQGPEFSFKRLNIDNIDPIEENDKIKKNFSDINNYNVNNRYWVYDIKGTFDVIKSIYSSLKSEYLRLNPIIVRCPTKIRTKITKR
ncbi:MAG: DUF2254 domain-containing protein [Chitinophagales bacterium]|nr:DUF2254 domain-containing protein [Chitinophagales bacterium]MDW8419585.1 DUF2254 family protein [Chitinophagales bacterium]